MGLEKVCEVRLGGRTAQAKALLESTELLVRGELKVQIPFSRIEHFEAKGGVLRVDWRGGSLALVLGSDAEEWAQKIRYPRSRLDKLGIKPGMRVAVLGVDDATFRAELADRTQDVAEGKPRKDTHVVVVGMTKRADLVRLGPLRDTILKNGAIWVVWPKGRAELREDDVRTFGAKVGLVDVKVVSFSDSLSGLKMVIPVKER